GISAGAGGIPADHRSARRPRGHEEAAVDEVARAPRPAPLNPPNRLGPEPRARGAPLFPQPPPFQELPPPPVAPARLGWGSGDGRAEISQLERRIAVGLTGLGYLR